MKPEGGFNVVDAEKQPLPLRLLRPPQKAKPQLKSTQRPAWTGAGGSTFDETEDNQLPIVRHKTSAQEWCLQAETSFSSKWGSNSNSVRSFPFRICLITLGP